MQNNGSGIFTFNKPSSAVHTFNASLIFFFYFSNLDAKKKMGSTSKDISFLLTSYQEKAYIQSSLCEVSCIPIQMSLWGAGLCSWGGAVCALPLCRMLSAALPPPHPSKV